MDRSRSKSGSGSWCARSFAAATLPPWPISNRDWKPLWITLTTPWPSPSNGPTRASRCKAAPPADKIPIPTTQAVPKRTRAQGPSSSPTLGDVLNPSGKRNPSKRLASPKHCPPVPQLHADGLTNLRRAVLGRATSHGAPSSLAPLRGITPLGWLVVVGTLAGGLSDGNRGRGLSLGRAWDGETEPLASLKELARLLAVAGAGDDDPPWSDFKSVVEACAQTTAERVFKTLAKLDDLLGITVENPDPSPHFGMRSGRGGTVEVITPRATVELPIWHVSADALQGEGPRDGVERFRARADDPGLHYRWSECWREGTLLSVGVLRPGLAALAGLQINEPASERRSVGTSAGTEPPLDLQPSAIENHTEPSGTGVAPEPSERATQGGERLREISSGPEGSNADKEALRELQQCQQDRKSTRLNSSHLGISY